MVSRNVRTTHAEHLRDPEIIAEYLNEALASGDKEVILLALRNVVEAQEDGVSGLAERAEMGRNSMYKLLSSDGNPKLNSFINILHALCLRMQVKPDDDRKCA